MEVRTILLWLLLGFIVGLAIGGGIVMLLWNFLLVPLCGFAVISFWQSVVIYLVLGAIFGGIKVTTRGN
jgi:hypothetical protein